MAIFHSHLQIITRGIGKSSVGAAAYRSGDKLYNEYAGVTLVYGRKGALFILKFYYRSLLRENSLTATRSGTLSRKSKNRKTRNSPAR
jgi:hypothetical protein